jgi:hypothetical protein
LEQVVYVLLAYSSLHTDKVYIEFWDPTSPYQVQFPPVHHSKKKKKRKKERKKEIKKERE